MTSHDTERLSSLIKNPDRNYDRDADERNPEYDPSKPDIQDYGLQKLIAAIQMTYNGSPMIYYGDEVGMWGADDPHCRKPMVWNDLQYDDEVLYKNSGFTKGLGIYTVKPNEELKKFYAKLIGIRNSNVELKRGDARFLFSNDKKNIFAFERVLNEKKSIIVFNLGNEEAEISLPSGFERFMYINLLTGQSGAIENFEGQPSALNITIQAQSFGIYKILNLEK
jgi:glycosidase